MYNDELYFEKELTQSELIDLIFLELIRKKIIELETLVKCGSQPDAWSTYRQNDEMWDEEDLWMHFADQAIVMIDREYIWNGIVEAFKIIKFTEPLSDCRSYFEQLYCTSSQGLSTMYTHLKRPKGFDNLLDYISCVCKLKFNSTL